MHVDVKEAYIDVRIDVHAKILNMSNILKMFELI